jgi:hypothetical protein
MWFVKRYVGSVSNSLFENNKIEIKKNRLVRLNLVSLG